MQRIANLCRVCSNRCQQCDMADIVQRKKEKTVGFRLPAGYVTVQSLSYVTQPSTYVFTNSSPKRSISLMFLLIL